MPAKDVFVKKQNNKEIGYNMATIFNRRMKAGEIGIEIEVEGNKFPKNDDTCIPSSWAYHKDGSLRGVDNAEYVLKNPIKFTRVPEEIKKLWDMFAAYGSVLDESNRTSVHVHLNAQKFHLNRLCAFMAMYFSVEEVLTSWCGEHRVGNLFCLRAKDAFGIVQKLKRFIQSNGADGLSEGLHYAGLNAHALSKFGSIEIRSLRGVNDPQIILDWVAVLERIYKLSAEFKDPREICENFSGSGPMSYFEFILGDRAETVRLGSCMDTQEIMQSLYEGIRIAQDLCYCRDWSNYEPVDTKPDPFGRKVKLSGLSLLSQLSDQEVQSIQADYESGTYNPNATPIWSINTTSVSTNHATLGSNPPHLNEVHGSIPEDWFEEQEESF